MAEKEGAGGEEDGAVALSEGELEEGEVLSSEEEEEDKEEVGGGGVADVRENGEQTAEKSPGVCDDESGRTAGVKRPAPDSASPIAKAPRLDSTLQDVTGTNSGSGAEEGEIFSDDEEAAYFPQLIKPRSTGTAGTMNHEQEREKVGRERDRESEASGSEAAEERKRSSRGRGYSTSPERDSFRSRQQRERDSEPKSLASLFFEDRDGGRSEHSDDGGRDGRRGDQHHSSSPSSKFGRNRDRERERDRNRDRGSDREKRDRNDSNYRRGKDSSYRSRDRDCDRDPDGSVDSSEEESAWSQRNSRGGSKHYQKGRKGTSSYQSKYGQKHDRFGGAAGNESRGAGGRQGGRENSQSSNWNPGAGRMNTGMTAQQFHALAEKVRKRREKGLPLLPTPKIKPTDNLDQFNYPAPPSWYLEAVENWDKRATAGGEGGGIVVDEAMAKTQLTTLESTARAVAALPPDQVAGFAGITGAEQIPILHVPPLFPQTLQFPAAPDLPNSSILGDPPHNLPPVQLGPVSSSVQLPPLPLSQAPVPLIPALSAHQLPSLFPPSGIGAAIVPDAYCKPLFPPPPVMGASVPLFPPPPPGVALSVPGNQTTAVAAVSQGEQPQGTVIGAGGAKEGVVQIASVEVSSLALSTCRKEEEEEDEEDMEGGGMKIALETPTPQPESDAKKFDLFRVAVATEHEAGAIKEDSPGLTKTDNLEVLGTGAGEMEEMETGEVCDKKEEKGDTVEKMEVRIDSATAPIPTLHETPQDKQEPMSAPPGVPAMTRPPFVSPDNLPPVVPGNTPTIVTPGNPQLVVDSPSGETPPPAKTLPAETVTVAPMIDLTVSKATPTRSGSGHSEPDRSHVESDPEDDLDYDKYLAQLNEEEEVVGGPSLAVSSLSSSLLQNNPLDEDFPAINPPNESSSLAMVSKKASGGDGESLRSLLGESLGSNGLEERDFPTKTNDSKGKSVRRRQKQAAWWARHRNQNIQEKSATRVVVKPPCQFYLQGFCKYGDACQYNHNVPRPKKKDVCKFYLQDGCTKGEECLYYHGEFPCKFYHTKTVCKNGEHCKFSHAALTDETRGLLAQVLEPTRNFMKKIELSAMGITDAKPLIPLPITDHPATPSPVSQQGGLQLVHGSDSQVRVRFFSSGDLSNQSDNFAAALDQTPSSTNAAQTPTLMVSIPNHILDKSLVISIPRQKLGPPFGTVPISAPSNVPPSQPSALPPPPHPSSAPQAFSGPPSATPQSSQVMNIRLPSVPPFPVPPVQSVPPHMGNFPMAPMNFPTAPRPNQPPPGILPPRPSGGWQPPSGQPVPLFPPAAGNQQNVQRPPSVPPNQAQIPPGQPLSSHMPPQSHLPPVERKGLLPTPPSHMRLDPQNIQWSEDGQPEYWEAPKLTQQSGRFPDPSNRPPPTPSQFSGVGPLPPGQPPGMPPPCGPFGTHPPPPHVPQVVGGMPAPFNPRQQLVSTRMDPRQNRMEPGPGSSMHADPRRGGGAPNPVPVQPRPGVGAGDPRQNVSGVQPDVRVPAQFPMPPGTLPPPQQMQLMPVQPAAVPLSGQRQWPLQQPSSLQPPNAQQLGLPSHSAVPLSFQAQGPIPIPPSSGGASTGIVPGGGGPVLPPNNAQLHVHEQQAPGMGRFGTGINPAPFQPTTAPFHLQPTDQSASSSSVWGSSVSPDYSSLPPPSSAPVPGNPQSAGGGGGDSSAAGGDMRSLRIDPRTKYSHFKIKTKGSPSSTSSSLAPSSLGSPSGTSGTTQSILRRDIQGEGGAADQISAGSERTSAPMPKLLQDPPPPQRPLDPRELFGSVSAKEVPSDYEVSGPFGSSSFGSFFSRSSETGESATKMPFGEITMPNNQTDNEAALTQSEEKHREPTRLAEPQEARENDRKPEDTKVQVPSYLAELGMGLGGDSSLTIDSAFSSLDKKGDADAGGGGGSGEQKTAVTAKKLPSIFSFGSGSL